MKVLDLFSGIGGFSLGLEWAGGFETIAFCEIGKAQRSVLERHWPEVRVFNDVTNTDEISAACLGADIIVGGDPCPIRSRARSNGNSKSPDLSGYFLSLCERINPRWVVRENVLAPDDVAFSACLEMLGYDTARATDE